MVEVMIHVTQLNRLFVMENKSLTNLYWILVILMKIMQEHYIRSYKSKFHLYFPESFGIKNNPLFCSLL
jgi:hypothetical protein